MTDVMKTTGFCELNDNEMATVDGGSFCFGITEWISNYVNRWSRVGSGPVWPRWSRSAVSSYSYPQVEYAENSGGGVR